jgi:hypothetical protein
VGRGNLVSVPGGRLNKENSRFSGQNPDLESGNANFARFQIPNLEGGMVNLEIWPYSDAPLCLPESQLAQVCGRRVFVFVFVFRSND